MQLRFHEYTCFAFIMFLSAAFSCSQKSNENATEVVGETEKKVVATPKKTILFFGNSLTAGYGIEPEDTFAGIIQQRIDSLELNYTIINGGLSGETTASGLNRLDWFLEDEPYIFMLELGGNDGLRGIDLKETRENLRKIIQSIREKHPNTHILLAGMQIPPNMGQTYTAEFQTIFPELAEEENVRLIPFLLEGVAGDPTLNLPDGIHPNEKGHRLVAETVWEHLQPLL